MNKTELMAEIAELEKAADRFGEPERTLKKVELSTLKIRLHGTALDDLSAALEKMPRLDLEEMKAKIAAAQDQTKAHQERIELFNAALNIIKTGLKIAI